MLSLLSKLPTILDCIGNWLDVRCPCGQVIDVCWESGELDADGQWESRAWIATHCPSCVIEAAPDKLRSSLIDRYDHLRRERLALGLGWADLNSRVGPIDPEQAARRSLGWHSETITLHAGTWRPPLKDGQRRPNDLFMVQMMIRGKVAESVSGRINPDAIASRPWYDLQPLELPQPHEGPVEIARVLLGATIYDPRRPGLQWRYGWNRSVPASEGFFSLPPDWQQYNYPPREIGAFVSRAMNLYQDRRQGGRPSKWTVTELQTLVQQYRDKNDGNDPTKETLAETASVDGDTILNTLKGGGIPTYRKFLESVPIRRGTGRTIRV